MPFDHVIIFRVDEESRLLFKLAARAAGIGLSEFLRRAAKKEARTLLNDPHESGEREAAA
jgi:uncharacterized protein (DUF1778 family)